MYRNSICYGLKMVIAGIAFLLMTAVTDAQNQKSIEALRQKVEKSRRETDSLIKRSDRMLKEMTDSINMASVKNMSVRSYEWLNQYQAERKRKQKQKAMLYLGFGAAMLAVLAYGLSRKKKPVS